MALHRPPRETTLAIVLGAWEASGHPNLKKMPGLENSARALDRYLTDPTGLGLPRSNVLSLLGNPDEPDEPLHDNPPDLLKRIREFLQGQVPKLKAASDLIFYYVGHGELNIRAGKSGIYYLLLPSSDANPETLLQFHLLLEAVRAGAPGLRYTFILDACYSGLAGGIFPSPTPAPTAGDGAASPTAEEIVEGVKAETPGIPLPKPLVLLCSSSANKTSRAPLGELYTMFSGALLEALWWGQRDGGDRLSVRDLGEMTLKLITRQFGSSSVIPEIYSSAAGEDDPASTGLFPNHGNALQWCVVLRESAGVSRLEKAAKSFQATRIPQINEWIKENTNLNLSLAEFPKYTRAAEVATSPAAFDHAVRVISRCELAFADVTDFQPVVMTLLGIRSVARRGVTICCIEKPDEALGDPPPFHLKEISLIRFIGDKGAGVGARFSAELEERVRRALAEWTRSPRTYLDMPVFEAVRLIPTSHEERANLVYNEQALMLCPFSATYDQRHWPFVRDNLQSVLPIEAANDEMLGESHAGKDPPDVVRSLDLGSPRLISLSLLHALRRTDLCVIDWSEWRGNIFFEMGIRLATNELDPVCVIEAAYEAALAAEHAAGDAAASGERLQSMARQCRGLSALYSLIVYTLPKPSELEDLDPFSRMAQRHRELRDFLFDKGAAIVEGTMPPGSVFRAVWCNFEARLEDIACPVEKLLRESADLLKIDEQLGESPFLYADAEANQWAEKARCERLLATWLYLHHRVGRNRLLASRQSAETYREVCDEVLGVLDLNNPDDRAMASSVQADLQTFLEAMKHSGYDVGSVGPGGSDG
jgi:Caspase domain